MWWVAGRLVRAQIDRQEWSGSNKCSVRMRFAIPGGRLAPGPKDPAVWTLCPCRKDLNRYNLGYVRSQHYEYHRDLSCQFNRLFSDFVTMETFLVLGLCFLSYQFCEMLYQCTRRHEDEETREDIAKPIGHVYAITSGKNQCSSE